MVKTMLSKFSESGLENCIASGKLLSRYVKKQALFAMLFAVLGLWLLQVVFSYLSELERISDSYTYVDAMRYILYRSPYFLEQFMPTGALLGAVVGLGLLANHSELTVMRSVGLSVYRIVGWVLVPAMLFVALALAVNQFVLPTSNQLASQIRDPDASLLASVSGYWTVQEGNSDSADRAGERDIVFIDYADENGNLGEVKRWRIDADNNLVSVSQAENGRYVRDRQSENNQSKDNQNEGKKGEIASESDTYDWQLSDVTTLNLQPLVQASESTVTVQNNDTSNVSNTNQRQSAELMASSQPLVTQTATASEQVTLPISPTSVHLLTRRAEDLSLTELYAFGKFNDAQNTRSLEHELAFWQKLLSPFAILSLVVVACSFVFGSLRTHSLGLRIVVALLFGLLFSYVQDLVGFISLATGVSPLLMVLLPILASVGLGVYLLKKQS